MKLEFIQSLEKVATKNENLFFLTGDLGFNAFEKLRDKIGERFINAGVAEQNMVSVAAGLASTGIEPWVYSISTFLTLKTLEQVRNDICHLNLGVRLVGFGGGYGYGIMGESHHLLEDVSIYSSLPNMQIFIPAFNEDVNELVIKMHQNKGTSYLRLNLVPKTFIKLPVYSSVRNIKKGNGITIIVLGPLIHNVLKALDKMDKNVGDVFCVTEIPFELSNSLISSIKKNKKILIVEEHTDNGGLGEKIFSKLNSKKIIVDSFMHLYAKGYISESYGNHAFHLKENQLDEEGIYNNIIKLIK